MICTNCSKPVVPVASLDIDGTLGNYHDTFRVFCANYFAKDGLRTLPPWPGVGEFEDYLGLTKAQYREAKLAWRQGGNKRWLPSYPGASELAIDIRRAGIELWVATTRPWQRLDNIDPDTKEWLRRNCIVIDGLLYGEDKYKQLVEHVEPGRILGVVEDLPEQLEVARGVGLATYMVDRSHNRDWLRSLEPADRPAHGSLASASVWLAERLHRWKESNA